MAESLRDALKRDMEAVKKLKGTGDKERRAKIQAREDEMFEDDNTAKQTPGRLGIISPEERQQVRQKTMDKGGVAQFASEVAPSIGGSIVGGLLGSTLGPVGTFAGAAIGGGMGEYVGQETGISPESDAAIIMSGASIGGPIAGKGAQLARRTLSLGIEHMPTVKAAVAHMDMQRAAGYFESVGTQIVGNRKGMMAKDASKLYAASQHFSGADVPIENFTGTLKKLRTTIDTYKSLPGMEAAMAKAEKSMQGALDSKTKSLGMADIMEVYKATSELAEAAAMSHSSPKVAEDIFKMFDKDIDKIVASGGKSGRATAFTQAAFQRSKLDRAVQTLERGAANLVTQKGDDALLNVGEMQKWLTNKTNPKHADYDKNMAEMLASDLPDIKHKLKLWAKTTENGLNPAGKNSMVVRGVFAGAGRAALGAVVAGPVGAAAGALIGSRLPEGIVSMLLYPKGRALLDASLRMGKGTINQGRWAQLTNMTTQALVRPGVVATERALKEE